MNPLENEIVTGSTGIGSEAATPLIGSAQRVFEIREMPKKSTMSSTNGINMETRPNNKVSTSLQSLNENIYGDFYKFYFNRV